MADLKHQQQLAQRAGLHPHHATGASTYDAHLFRHRYQQLEVETGRLTYYEYEARRHASVMMLEDLGIVS